MKTYIKIMSIMTLSLLATHIQAGKTEYLNTAIDLIAYPKKAHNRPFKPPFIDANGYFIIHQHIRDIGNHVTEDGDPISLEQDIKLVLQLMNQVENINIQTVGEGHSILHVAVMLGDTYLDFVKTIVEHGQALGLRLDIRNANGDRAVDIALQRGFGGIAHYLSGVMGIEYNRNLLRSATSSSAGPQSTSSGRTQWASSTVSSEDASASVTQLTSSESKTVLSNIPSSMASFSTLSSSSSAALGVQQTETVAVQQEREAVTPAAIPLAVTTGSGTGSDFFPVRRPHLDTPLPNIKANNGRVIKHRDNHPQPAPIEKPWYKNTFFRKAGATVLGLGLMKSLYSLYNYLVNDDEFDYTKDSPLNYIWFINYPEELAILEKEAENTNNFNELDIIEELVSKGQILLLKAYNKKEFKNLIREYSSVLDQEKNQNVPMNKILCLGFPKDSTFAQIVWPNFKTLEQSSPGKHRLKILYDRRYVKT